MLFHFRSLEDITKDTYHESFVELLPSLTFALTFAATWAAISPSDAISVQLRGCSIAAHFPSI